MIRLFVGLDLPPEIADHVYSLRGGLENARWQEKEKLHLTLYFIGNVPEDKVHDIIQELRAIRFPGPLTCRLKKSVILPLERFRITFGWALSRRSR